MARDLAPRVDAHQYQRRMSTSPVPAPRARRSSQAFSTLEGGWEVTPMDREKDEDGGARETAT